MRMKSPIERDAIAETPSEVGVVAVPLSPSSGVAVSASHFVLHIFSLSQITNNVVLFSPALYIRALIIQSLLYTYVYLHWDAFVEFGEGVRVVGAVVEFVDIRTFVVFEQLWSFVFGGFVGDAD